MDKVAIEVQKRTFTNWANSRLKSASRKVKNLETDFEDGVLLIALLQNLAPESKMPKYYSKPPSLKEQKVNLEAAFHLMTEVERIPLPSIGPQDMIENNLELILNLLWHLVWFYQISASGDEQLARQLLLGWVNSSVPGMATNNFTSDWSSGLRLCALIEHCQPGLIPNCSSLDQNNALQNIENAMSLAEKHLKIPRVLQPEDLAVPMPDELSVMTYISFFCQPGSAGRYMVLKWINQRIPKQVSNFTTDWVDGCALGALIDAVSGGRFPEHKQMKAKNILENCKISIDAAARVLAVQPIITPEQFASSELDRLQRITYLTQFMYTMSHLSTPTTVTVAGPGISGALCGGETFFEVKARLSTKDQLQVSVATSTGSFLPVKYQPAIGTHTYTYKPENPGMYSVQVKLGGEHVTGSPFKVRHSSPYTLTRCIAEGTGLTAARVDNEAEFTVVCETGVPGELQVKVKGPSGSVATGIRNIKERTYVVNFIPYEVGTHTITVLWGSKDITGSPFECCVTDPTKCIASGAGLKSAVLGQLQEFQIKADKAGSGVLTAECKSVDGALVPVAIKEEGIGSYRCTYMPRVRGDHTLNVWWSNVPITGSPFAVQMTILANATKCTVIGLPTGRLKVGRSYGFTVDTSDAGQGELVVTSSGVVKYQVTETERGKHYISFTPTNIGLIQMVLFFANMAIPGSPFEFKVNDPSKCSVALSAGPHYNSHPIDFVVYAHQAGEGELTVIAQTLQAMVDVEVRKQADGNYLCRYLPQVDGPQAINIYFDKVAIPDATIWLDVQAGFQVDKVIVTQPIPGRFGAFMTEQPYEFQITTTGVSPAKLTANGKGVFTGKMLPLSVVEVERDHYKVAIEAAEPDQYVINIKWGEEGVPGSPFLIKIEDKPHADRVVVEGPHYLPGLPGPVKLSINAEKAGAGELVVTCHGEKVDAVPVDIQQLQAKIFSASFVAKEPDLYTVKVIWAYVSVPGSPFKVDTTPPDSSKCIVIGPDVPLETFKPVELVVDTTQNVSGKLTAAAIGRSTGATGIIDIKELSPGKHCIQLHTSTADIYTLAVRLADQHIGKSPYTLNLHPPIPTAVTISQPPTQMVDAGQSISILFNSKKAGRGNLVATCVGNKMGEIPTKTTQTEDSIWEVRFAPSEPDVYSLSVKWAREHIRGSPFNINLMPLNVSNVKVVGPTQPEGNRDLVELQVITKGAGKGKLAVKVSGSKAGVVPVQVVETEQDSFLITFRPPMTDIYSLEVLFGGQNIKGSPFLINTMVPDASKVVVVQATPAVLSQVVSFHCDTSQAGAGVLASSCHGDKHGPIQVETVKVDSNHHTVSFTPSVPDRYNLKLEWSGTEVKGSPILINLLPVVPYKVAVGELHVPSTIGKGEMVYVDLDYSHVGLGTTTAIVKGNQVGDIPVDVDTVSAFVRRVKFVPRMRDVYNLSILFAEGHVSGSPFVINLLPPQAQKIELLELMTSFGAPGPITFLFNTSNAGKGNMNIRASGSATGPVTSQVRVVSPGRCKAWFTPLHPDTYKVDVTWENFPVPNFPFTINLLPLCYPERVICGHPVIRTVGKPVVTTIDTSKAGKGKITAQCQGRKSGQVSVEVETENGTVYRATFVPDVEDIYDLRIFYNDKEVLGSPIQVNLVRIKEDVELQIIEEQVWTTLLPPDTMTLNGGNPVTDSPSADQKQPSATPPPPLSSALQRASYNTLPAFTSTTLPRTPSTPSTLSAIHSPVSSLPPFLRARASSTIPRPLNRAVSPSPLPEPKPVHTQPAPLPTPSSSPVHKLEPVLSLGLGDSLKILLVDDGEIYGNLNVSAVGAETGLTDVKLTNNGDGTVTIIFTPDKADRYVLTIQLNGEHILYSPFIINSLGEVNPDKCVIFGLKGAYANATVGQELKFGVNTSKAGDGNLEVKSEGPSEDGYPSELEVYPGEQMGISHIVYIPTAPGVHRIHLTWSGVPIPGSPVDFTVQDVEKPEVKIYPVGKKVPLEVAVDCKISDLSANCCHKETGTEYKVKIRRISNGPYKFKIVPKAVGTYVMRILAKDKEIAESPVYIKVGPPPDPAAVQVQDYTKMVCINQPVQFTIDASKGGAGFLSVSLTPPKGTKDSPAITTKCKALIYTVSFVPAVVGEYTVVLSWANQPIPVGPYIITVKDKECDVLSSLSVGTNVVLLNHLVDLQLLNLPLGHKVTAQAFGVIARENVEVVMESQPHQCSIRFQPNKPDRYLLEVKVNGFHVKGSPFRIVAIDSASLCSGNDIPPAIMPLRGTPVNLILPLTIGSDPSQIVASTESPSTSLPTSINTGVNGVVVFSFTPNEPGVHHMQAKLGDAPFNSSLIPISQWTSDCHLVKEDLDVFSKAWSLTPNLKVSFRVSTELGGNGNLDATVVECPAKLKAADSTASKVTARKKVPEDPAKEPDVKVENNNDQTHTCTIMPWAVGRYVINVLWNSEHIEGSPFTLNVKQPEIIIGLQLENETFQVGIPSNLTIHCDFEEAGQFELLCIPSSGAEILVEPIPGKKAYKCEILPLEPGPHELNVLYNGEHILGSPIFVQFLEQCGASYCTLVSSTTEQYEIGQPVEFIISTKGAGNGTLTAEVQNVASGATLPISVERIEKGDNYRLEFTPGQSNEYLLTVKFDGQHIVGSPFNLVFAEPLDISQCRAEGEGLVVANVDKLNVFLVHKGAEEIGELQVLIEGDSNMKGPHTFRRNDTTYEILYTPSREGNIRVIVTWNGEHIQGSPFNVMCCRPSDPMLFSVASAPTETHCGKEVAFKVSTTQQNFHKGVMSVVAKSPNGKVIDGTAKAVTRQEYDCTLLPLESGVHEVSVRWNGKDINGSPFNITVMDNLLRDKIKVYGSGLTTGAVGRECEFTVDTSSGGAGTLLVRLHGPKGTLRFKMRKDPSNDRSIIVTYTPNEEGPHKITVLWSEETIPGSPFIANITAATSA